MNFRKLYTFACTRTILYTIHLSLSFRCFPKCIFLLFHPDSTSLCVQTRTLFWQKLQFCKPSGFSNRHYWEICFLAPKKLIEIGGKIRKSLLDTIYSHINLYLSFFVVVFPIFFLFVCILKSEIFIFFSICLYLLNL